MAEYEFPTEDAEDLDTWWALSQQRWPTMGAGCHSTDRSVELTFRLLDRK